MSHYSRAASTDEQEEAITTLEVTLGKLNKRIVDVTTIGKSPQTVILDLTYHGGEIYIDADGTVHINDEEVQPDDTEAVKDAINIDSD